MAIASRKLELISIFVHGQFQSQRQVFLIIAPLTSRLIGLVFIDR